MRQLTELMLIEDIYLNTYHFELVCKFIYINAEILHANLSNTKQMQLMKKFKNFKTSLMIFMIIYQVLSQSTNLDFYCFRVIIIVLVINALLKI